MILVTWASAALMIWLALLGGTPQPWSLVWQPGIVGILFLAGQLFTLMAIRAGDVSIATPVLGVKVILVPAVATQMVGETAAPSVWLAALIATVGVMLVQQTDASVARGRILAAVALALLACASMTLFDLSIQRWAPAWGAGLFLALAFSSAALCSLLFLPCRNRAADLRRRPVPLLLLAGSVLMALQAFGMTFTLANFGDATRVNIVYSLRGLWGVALTWVLVRRLGGHRQPSNRVMGLRLSGAALIGVSVVLAVSE